MWTKLKNFINSMCLILAPYLDVCKFGAPMERSQLRERRDSRCSKIK
ncbi:hypothetical protein Pogu_1308 [Pyrobaculum oguniense TE7]|uniref:Uncharacterized protein n=1 Tax=Pyrobaculum oguniense (strain DSM 13380 / JCM 10595 / TE7) TaxID=698757 RepID=H6QAD4_PYROT|nr:hypothetical protein Pogu_1308 [Pyrobaculum oguniense TE7]